MNRDREPRMRFCACAPSSSWPAAIWMAPSPTSTRRWRSAPHDRDDLQLDGDILMKMGRTEEAIRDLQAGAGHGSQRSLRAHLPRLRLARAGPQPGCGEVLQDGWHRWIPIRTFPTLPSAISTPLNASSRRPQAAYSKAYAISSQTPLIVAGGMNAGIEAHNLSLAAQWVHRATTAMANDPQVLREEERLPELQGRLREIGGPG